jgi:hypothetical protein
LSAAAVDGDAAAVGEEGDEAVMIGAKDHGGASAEVIEDAGAGHVMGIVAPDGDEGEGGADGVEEGGA